MTRFRSLAFVSSCAAALVFACGGVTTTDLDAGGGADSGGNDGGSKTDGGGGQDSGGGGDSGGGVDAGPVCPAYVTSSCDNGCPNGTVCVTRNAGAGTVSGCYPTTQCGNEGLCDCLSSCVCTYPGSQCSQQSTGLYCSGGPISRREFKTDIAYVSDDERASLAAQALATHLAEYRYKAEPEGHKRHLGFIIDDLPAASPAVQADRTHVDEYGYTSMLLATVQEQQKQIDELKKQVAALKKR